MEKVLSLPYPLSMTQQWRWKFKPFRHQGVAKILGASPTPTHWRGFMRRNALPLKPAKGNRMVACRSEWTTFENILEMYNLVYVNMIDAGLAQKISPLRSNPG
jgi:hypothetical protein